MRRYSISVCTRMPSTRCRSRFISFFFNDAATTEIYTLSLHDALPIFERVAVDRDIHRVAQRFDDAIDPVDRKSTRLNSSHVSSSYAVFCLKKKTPHQPRPDPDIAPPGPKHAPARPHVQRGRR